MADYSSLEAMLGYTFRDRSTLEQALRHASWCNEHPAERLEVLARERVHVLCMAPTEYRVCAKRATLPALPAGCVQVVSMPLHTSRVQGLPSSLQALSLAARASAGQAALEPSQASAGSHSPAEPRQTVPLPRMVQLPS